MNLTDEEIRIKVAEAMGARLWNNPTQSGPSQLWGFQAPYPGEVFARMWLCGEADCLLPNYPEDLNATHEMEATLEWEQFADYQTKLEKVVQSEWTERSRFPCHREFATARQRCIAYLKTKGLIP